MKKPLSVWVLDPANLTPFYSLALCGGLADAGVDVRFATSPFHYDAGTDGQRTDIPTDYEYFTRFKNLQTQAGAAIRKLTRAALYPAGHRRVLVRAKRERPDVVHIQWSRMPWLDARLVSRLQRLGIRVVHTVHDVEPLYRGSGGRNALGRVYKECDALIVHTNANAKELVQRYPEIDPLRIHVVPHGPLQAETQPPNATRSVARRELNIPPSVPVALFFGTIKPYKGLDILLAALPKIAKAHRDICLLIAGKPGDPADVPDLETARKLGIDVRTEFGFIANADVWKYYLACDAVVLPYRNITQSGVLLSGLAFGRAAVVTRVGGLPEIIEAGDAGWVVPPEDPDALAQATIAAFADLSATHDKGARAAQFVASEYSWQKIGATTKSLYQSLMTG